MRKITANLQKLPCFSNKTPTKTTSHSKTIMFIQNFRKRNWLGNLDLKIDLEIN